VPPLSIDETIGLEGLFRPTAYNIETNGCAICEIGGISKSISSKIGKRPLRRKKKSEILNLNGLVSKNETKKSLPSISRKAHGSPPGSCDGRHSGAVALGPTTMKPELYAKHSRFFVKSWSSVPRLSHAPDEVPVKSKRDEEKWRKAKAIAKERGQGDNYALIMGIYKKMDPDYFKKAAAQVASRWLRARRDAGLWQQFLDEMYEGGKKMVRNTNRDTRDRYPQVEALTLLKTDSKFRKLLRGQFDRWRAQRERAGPPGETVRDLGELEPGQTLEWSSGRDRHRGVVQRARPDRAILMTESGQTVHMRPWEVAQLSPRVI